MLNWLPEDISTYGKDIDSLFYVIYYITAVVFLLVTVAMVVFLIKYRYREGRKAIYTHGSTTLEVIWTVIPAIILIVLALKSQAAWSTVKMNIPAGDVQIRVLAKQFNWDVTYPGPDGQFGTEDDLPRPGNPPILDEIHVPVNKVVRVELIGKDVIHSFFLPNLRLKQDVLPGRTISAWFEATKPGRYQLPCAELCGIGHSGMLGTLIVHTPEEYAAWVAEKWPSQ